MGEEIPLPLPLPLQLPTLPSPLPLPLPPLPPPLPRVVVASQGGVKLHGSNEAVSIGRAFKALDDLGIRAVQTQHHGSLLQGHSLGVQCAGLHLDTFPCLGQVGYLGDLPVDGVTSGHVHLALVEGIQRLVTRGRLRHIGSTVDQPKGIDALGAEGAPHETHALHAGACEARKACRSTLCDHGSALNKFCRVAAPCFAFFVAAVASTVAAEDVAAAVTAA